MLNPALYLVVYYVVFQLILKNGVPYFTIYLLSGLLVWNLFSTGLGSACSSVVANAGLVKKVAFPREILPLAAVGSMLVHFFLQSMVLFATLAVLRWDVAWTYVAFLPLALIALLILTGALGILLSAANVYLRDTQHFLELALLAWFWVTPIVYGFMTIGRRGGGWFYRIYLLNPVTPIVLLFQRAIYAKLDNPNVQPTAASPKANQILPHWPMTTYLAYLGYSFAIGIAVMAIAVWVFGRSEANFAEEL
jgi:ABC-type polysaccharide/polyol phosphate export permease